MLENQTRGVDNQTTSAELIKATERIRGKIFSTQQMLESYIVPLINSGYVDRVDSKIDRRSYIFFPVLNAKQRKLFDSVKTNNLSRNRIVSITDSTLFPNRNYLISKIQGVLRYSSEKGIIIKLEDHHGNEIAVEELVDQYYKDPENYFEVDSKLNNNTPADSSSLQSLFTTTLTKESKSSVDAVAGEEEQQQTLSQSSLQRTKEEQEKNFVNQGVSDEYLESMENANELYENTVGNTKSIQSQNKVSKKLFDSVKTNNLFYFNKLPTGMQNKSHQQSTPSAIVPLSEVVSPSLQPEKQEQELQQCKNFNCFYRSQSYSSDKERVKHIDYEHPGKLYYPTQEDFERRLL